MDNSKGHLVLIEVRKEGQVIEPVVHVGQKPVYNEPITVGDARVTVHDIPRRKRHHVLLQGDAEVSKLAPGVMACNFVDSRRMTVGSGFEQRVEPVVVAVLPEAGENNFSDWKHQNPKAADAIFAFAMQLSTRRWWQPRPTPPTTA